MKTTISTENNNKIEAYIFGAKLFEGLSNVSRYNYEFKPSQKSNVSNPAPSINEMLVLTNKINMALKTASFDNMEPEMAKVLLQVLQSSFLIIKEFEKRIKTISNKSKQLESLIHATAELKENWIDSIEALELYTDDELMNEIKAICC